jgi:L-xylulokinase
MPEDIASVAVCGHGKGLYLWGKIQKPVRKGILSTDNRAWEYTKGWREDGTEAKVFTLACQHIMPCQPVALLAWLRDHEPDVLEETEWIFECKDYIRFRLTGEARAERSDYSGANFINLHTGAYDPELLALFGLMDCMDKLPPLAGATDLCGCITGEVAKRTGLKPGTPVAGGAFDIDACAAAVNVVDEAHICMNTGTWSINEYLCRRPVINGSVLMNSFFCIPPYYLVEECSPTGAGNNAWFINNLLPELQRQGNVYETMNQWVESIAPTDFCPVFLPFLLASNVYPNAKGGFIGLSSYHTRAHLVRSVYEGVVFSHRYHLEKLLRNKETATASIRLAGGIARSTVWTQMFADVMQLPVEVVEVNETGALGCAIIGSVAVGDYENITAAAKTMCRVAPAVKPNASLRETYDKKYRLYLRTIEALDGLWDEMQTVIDGK